LSRQELLIQRTASKVG